MYTFFANISPYPVFGAGAGAGSPADLSVLDAHSAKPLANSKTPVTISRIDPKIRDCSEQKRRYPESEAGHDHRRTRRYGVLHEH
jgi:hypothetical protein